MCTLETDIELADYITQVDTVFTFSQGDSELKPNQVANCRTTK